jgi:hypothetical protein
MMARIADPLAEAVVTWKTAEQGGRRSGPPTAPVYAATAVFMRGDDREVQPGWPAAADQLSILLEQTAVREGDVREYKVDFLVRELAIPQLAPGVEILVLEGPRVVASARVTAVHLPR